MACNILLNAPAQCMHKNLILYDNIKIRNISLRVEKCVYIHQGLIQMLNWLIFCYLKWSCKLLIAHDTGACVSLHFNVKLTNFSLQNKDMT